MHGRRRSDSTAPDEYEPGDYGRRRITVGEQTYWTWWVRTPNGLLGRLSAPEDNPARHHEVEEHEDGTVSVIPRPGNSNSILIEGGSYVGDTTEYRRESWHGYIEHGVWRSC